MELLLSQNPLLLLLLAMLVVMPSVLAFARNHPYWLPICLVNLLGAGLFGIGWVVAMVWCFIDPARKISLAGEIERLHQLLERGAITRAEFEAGKRVLLGG